MIIKSDEVNQITRYARMSCRDKGRFLRWEIHADGESATLRVFYAVRFATAGEEKSFDVSYRPGNP